MKITIDNLDGVGAVDYTSCVEFGTKTTIRRVLYKPNLCNLVLLLAPTDVMPVKGGRVAIADSCGILIFTGYITEPPSFAILGEDTSGSVYKANVAAISDDAALDASVSLSGTTLIGQSASQSWNALAGVSSSTNLPVSLSGQLVNAGRVRIEEGARWSEAAQSVSMSTRSAYRALAQTVRVSSIGEITHSIASDDSGLMFESISASDLRWLARDVTVIGAEEPRAYITEIFQGDGVTTSFAMTREHFVPAKGQKTNVVDTFQGTKLNPSIWSVSDGAGHIALTAGGLSCLGGTGREAESTVSSVQQIELGGNVIIEGTGVQISTGSAGTVLGLYAGSITTKQCFAGFQVNSAGTNVNISPLVQGAAAGSTFQVVQGRLYTLRLRLSSPETERIRQTYTYVGDAGTASLGGEAVTSSGYLQLEVQDVTSGAPSAPTVLYSGFVSAIPPACVLAMLSSGSLVCSIKGMSCSQTAPLRVMLASGGAGAVPQFLGSAAQGGSCSINTSNTLQFYPSSVPSTGSLIFVNYRSRARAISRRSLPQLPDANRPSSTQVWVGSVNAPAAWSSVDCDHAATAILHMAASASAAVKGRYSVTVQDVQVDIWPGDVLAIGPLPNSQVAEVVVRDVEISMFGCEPALFGYQVRFANDWAENLNIHLSSRIAEDAILPQQVTGIDTALDSLNALSVSGLTNASLSLDTGVYAPINGGFEVRRRDDTFGPGLDSDLVLRTSARNVTISRTSAVEQFYVRMYDGAVPPNYSLVSAAVFVNVPL